MTKTCSVVAEIFVDKKMIESRSWKEVDVMKTSHTRGWARRRFNQYLKDFASCGLSDKVIQAYWRCDHGAPSYTSYAGRLSGVRGKVMAKSGIFDQ